ncbi:MAG: hypothetical protein ACRDLB_10720 [Actinomycetota bacterium]
MGEEILFEDPEARVRIEVLSTDGDAYTLRVSNGGDYDAGTPVTFDRTVTAGFVGDAQFEGTVAASDEALGCFQEIKVKVQKRTKKKFKTVGKAFTDANGNFSFDLSNTRGKKFRALVSKLKFSPFNTCAKAASSIVKK